MVVVMPALAEGQQRQQGIVAAVIVGRIAALPPHWGD